MLPHPFAGEWRCMRLEWIEVSDGLQHFYSSQCIDLHFHRHLFSKSFLNLTLQVMNVYLKK